MFKLTTIALLFSILLATLRETAAIEPPSASPVHPRAGVVEAPAPGLGEPIPTERELDLFIQGEGYFRINQGNGEFRYTRDGSFRKDPNGDLVTADGFRLEPSISVPPVALEVAIATDGAVSARVPGTEQLQTIGQILLTRFNNPEGLRREWLTCFRVTEDSGWGVNLAPGTQGVGLLRQGYLETLDRSPRGLGR